MTCGSIIRFRQQVLIEFSPPRHWQTKIVNHRPRFITIISMSLMMTSPSFQVDQEAQVISDWELNALQIWKSEFDVESHYDVYSDLKADGHWMSMADNGEGLTDLTDKWVVSLHSRKYMMSKWVRDGWLGRWSARLTLWGSWVLFPVKMDSTSTSDCQWPHLVQMSPNIWERCYFFSKQPSWYMAHFKVFSCVLLFEYFSFFH